MRRFYALLISAILILCVIPLKAAVLPTGFSEVTVASGLTNATAFAFAPDGRIFIAQQDGDLRIVKNGTLLSEIPLSLPVNSIHERGFIGIAVDPDFATNSYIYVHYTKEGDPLRGTISRFTMNGDSVVQGSETILIQTNPLTATNHNGGAIHFGVDGKLYIGIGENAVRENAQTLDNLLGKILRINKDGTIPTDNPFYNTATGQNRAIWAYGLRNPYTFAIEPETGRMFINDVGELTWEEINEGIAGANYGWPDEEGENNINPNPAYTYPLYAYSHGEGCAIAGGAFYNPDNVMFPGDFVGDYFFADFCGDWIKVYDSTTDSVADFVPMTTTNLPVDLRVADDGSLYYLTRFGLYRVTYDASTANGNLIVNGGFEIKTGNMPTHWSLFRVTKDRVRCNVLPDKVFARSGDCAVKLANARLIQTARPSGLEAGDTLTLRAWVKAKNLAPGSGVIKITVIYPGGARDNTKTAITPGTYDYTEFVAVASLAASPQRIKTRLLARGLGGKYFVDDIQLIVNQTP